MAARKRTLRMTTTTDHRRPADELTAEPAGASGPRPRIRRAGADAARGRGRGARRRAARPRPWRGSSGRPSTPGCTAGGCPSSSAARAGRCSSGSWSTSSSAGSPAACTGTCRASTTSGSRDAGADRALRGAGAARRGRRRLRGHRGRGRLGSRAGSLDRGGARDGGWRINGEKWFVTSGDVARVLIVMANVVDGAERLPTLFLVEPGTPGVEFVDDPHVHPQLSPRSSDDPLHRRRGRGRRGDRRRGQRRRAAAAVVHRGAAGDRHPRAGRDVAAARRDDRLGADPRPGRPADHGLPGDLVPARRLGHRRHARAAAGPAGVRDGRRRAPTPS